MIMYGEPQELLSSLLQQHPEARAALKRSQGIKGQIHAYQAAAIFALAQYHDGGNFLEIGTLSGYSASIMAQAAPHARIVTLNAAAHEIPDAEHNLEPYPNVTVQCAVSWEYLESYDGPDLSLIFVDGDHVRVARDFPWFNHLKPGGVILFHDYTPDGSYITVQELDRMRVTLGRMEFDVKLIDAHGHGLVGFVKREGERWKT